MTDAELEKLKRAELTGEDGYTTATMEEDDTTNTNEGNSQKDDAVVGREGILRTGGKHFFRCWLSRLGMEHPFSRHGNQGV